MIQRYDAGTLLWMESGGGPLLLVPGEYLPFWGGIDPPTDGRQIVAHFRYGGDDAPATDYDRACDVDDYLGVIEVGSGCGVVLGDEPLPTAIVPPSVKTILGQN